MANFWKLKKLEFVPEQYKESITLPERLTSAQNRLKKPASLEIKSNVVNLDCKIGLKWIRKYTENSFPDHDSVVRAERWLDLDTDGALPDPLTPVSTNVEVDVLKNAPSSGKVYKRIETSGQTMGRQHMNRSDMSLGGNHSGKITDKMCAKDRSLVEKHSMSEPSKGKGNVPLKQDKQTCKSPVGRSQPSGQRMGGRQDMNRSNMRLGGNYSGKSVEEIHAKNRSQVEKHSMSEPSKEKGNVPLKQDKQTCKSPVGRSQPSGKSISNDTEAAVARSKVQKTLSLFNTTFRGLAEEEELKSKESRNTRIDYIAAETLKKNNKFVNFDNKNFGAIPGVEVGDEFHYRVELAIIGLHRPYQAGIDFIKRDGKILATSIVACCGGSNDYKKSSDVLIYFGEGGIPTHGSTVPTDQKLVRGNLALKNSMDEQSPVRVIRWVPGVKAKGVKANNRLEVRKNRTAALIYDGVYLVEKFTKRKGRYGTDEFEFRLRRISDQEGLTKKK